MYLKKIKNKDGSYSWKGTEDGPKDPVTGERRQITRRGKTKTEVKAKIEQALKEIKKNMGSPLSKVCFKDFLPEWVETYKKGKVKPSTYQAHKRNIKTYLLPAFGNMEISKLTRTQYQKFINKLLETRKVTSVKHINATMSSAMRQAYFDDKIIKNPTEGIVIRKIEEDHIESKIQYWTKPEINTFLKACKDDGNYIYYYFFLTLIFTGLRKGEAMALLEEDINEELGCIDVNKTLLYHVDNSKEDSFGPPKTKNSYRKVTIDKFLIQELKQLKLLKKKNKLMHGEEYSKFNFVFCKTKGERLRDRTIQTAFERIKKRAGVTDIKIHDLRHTHAVMCLESGMTLKEIQDRLGHKDIMTTDIYSHVTQEMKTKSIDKFANHMADVTNFN